MSFIEVLGKVVNGIWCTLVFAIWMFFIFLISGVFNGFNWDIKEFLLGISIPLGILFGVAFLIWKFVNRRKN